MRHIASDRYGFKMLSVGTFGILGLPVGTWKKLINSQELSALCWDTFE
jgi:hypothetical protein